jgi:transmembrane sensor
MMDDLLGRVRDAQDAALEDASVRDAVEGRVVDAARAPRAGSPARWPWVAAALVLLAVGATWSVTRTPVPLTYGVTGGVESIGSFVAAREGTAELAFSDGSALTLAESGALRVVALDAHGASVALEAGTLSAHVVHRDGTSWRVYGGPFAIVVTGTMFESTWDPRAARLHVEVTEGSVRVEGSCLEAPRAVTTGEEVDVSCPGWSETTVVTVAPRVDVIAEEETLPVPDRALARERPAPRSPSEADVPALAEPLVAPESDVVVDPPEAPADLDAMLESAQHAALAGDIATAERGFRGVRASSPGTDESALAAFLLGRLAFDEQRDYDEAARWFHTYGEERPNGTLAREALGRELEARVRSHDPSATEVAQRYLARFPDGPHAARARDLAPP